MKNFWFLYNLNVLEYDDKKKIYKNLFSMEKIKIASN